MYLYYLCLANPHPSLRWYEDTSPLSSTPNTIIESDDDTGLYSLTLKSLTAGHKADYRVHFWNSEGELSVSVTVTVLRPDEKLEALKKDILLEEEVEFIGDSSVEPGNDIRYGEERGPQLVSVPEPVVVKEGEEAIIGCRIKGYLMYKYLCRL